MMNMHPMLSVPTVDERVRIPMSVIHNLVQMIAEKYQPLKIILFGSYGYGKPRPESDVDLLLNKPSPLIYATMKIDRNHPFP